MLELERLLDSFRNYLKTLRKSNHTIDSYQYDLQQFLVFVQQAYHTSSLSFEQFKTVCYDYLDSVHTYGKEQEYEISSLNRKRSSLRRFIKFLYNREHIPDNFSYRIESLRENEKATKDVLNASEIERVEQCLTRWIQEAPTEHQRFLHSRNKLLFVTLLYTGLRVSELVALKWSHIQWEKELILVEKGKGNKQRTIPLKEELAEEMAWFQEKLKEMNRFKEAWVEGYLFFAPSNPTKSLSKRSVERFIDIIVKEVEISQKTITPHTLRHTMASFAIKNQMSIPVLSSILGHSRSSITLDIYSHVIDEDQRTDEMKKLSFKTS